MKIWIKDKHGRYRVLPPGIDGDLLTKFDDGEIGILTNDVGAKDGYWPSWEAYRIWCDNTTLFEDQTIEKSRVILRLKE